MLKIISNTTPIITLLTISQLEILKEMYEKIIIPKGVFEEIEEGKHKDFYTDLSKIDWIEIREISDKTPLKYLHDLDKGESEVIVLANELKADMVIIDEKLGREYAEYYDLKVTGTLGILLKAKELGLINQLSTLLETMVEKGIWLSPKLKTKIFELANEQ